MKPQRKKKVLSPVPKRSNPPEASTEKKADSPPVNRQTDKGSSDSAGHDVTSCSADSNDKDGTGIPKVPPSCDNLKCEQIPKSHGDKDLESLQVKTKENKDKADENAELGEPTTEYEVMSQVKHPENRDVKDQEAKNLSSSMDKNEVIDTYQIASEITRKSSLDRKDVIDTYQIAADVVGKGNSLDRKDVIDTYQLAGEIAKFRERDSPPSPCPAGIKEEIMLLDKASESPPNKGISDEGLLVPENAAVQYENNNSVVAAWGGKEEEAEGTEYENNGSLVEGKFSAQCRDSKGFTPLRDSKGFSPLRESKEFQTTMDNEDANEGENPYDATLFQQSKDIPKPQNIPNAQCEPKHHDPKTDDEPNANVNVESNQMDLKNCDKKSNIPKDSHEKDVIYEVPIKVTPKKEDIPKKKPSVRKPSDGGNAGGKIPEFPRKPKPPLVPKPRLKSDITQTVVSAIKKDNCDVPVCDRSGGEYVTLRDSTPPHQRLSNGVSVPSGAKSQGIC